jgi:Fur family transcriptional regulator, ferric uptake regulator
VTTQHAMSQRGAAGETVDEAMELIRQRGGRSTKTRRAVIEALVRAAEDHRTAEELAVEVQSEYPSTNESTVYRTLELLEELGVVSHVHLGHGPSQWHLRQTHPRWYLTCATCQKVAETAPHVFADLVSQVADSTGFTLDPGHFAVTGTCAECAARDRESAPEGRRT